MATHAEILFSLLEELNRFDHRVGALLKSNREQIMRANACLADKPTGIPPRWKNDSQGIV